MTLPRVCSKAFDDQAPLELAHRRFHLLLEPVLRFSLVIEHRRVRTRDASVAESQPGGVHP